MRSATMTSPGERLSPVNTTQGVFKVWCLNANDRDGTVLRNQTCVDYHSCSTQIVSPSLDPEFGLPKKHFPIGQHYLKRLQTRSVYYDYECCSVTQGLVSKAVR